ncbi:MAG: ClpXP protease specificity-enhancing factor [Pseudomonadales bacterium]|nr:ClpXP protease specificity-enhancing factor [Pseudomonadales bacterium]
MTSHRPYLVRALNEWILDNNCTPYLLVNAYASGVQVPQDFVKDGQIVLNISPTAVQGLVMDNEGLEFNGRFRGIPTHVYVPIAAVMGIYARENGQGMIFEYDNAPPPPPAPTPTPVVTDSGGAEVTPLGKRKPKGKPSLKVVK